MKEFVEKGVYIIPNYKDLFLCERVNNRIGKLVLYNKISKDIYERTQIQYFLNYYKENDIKELFLNAENYELMGIIDINFKLSADKKNLIKEKV